MKVACASLAASLLLACGSEPGPTLTLFVDPPMPPDLCVGVAGFEVLVSSGSGEAPPVRKRVPSTILNGKDCLLPNQFSFPDIDADAPVNVTVNGYDGGGKVRVKGQTIRPNLREGSVHVPLGPGPSTLPLLVIYRNPLLDGVPLEKVSALTVTKPMGGTGDLLSVDRTAAGEFFDAEPGAYGIPRFVIEPPAIGTALMVDFTAEGMVKSKRINVVQSTGTYYLAQ